MTTYRKVNLVEEYTSDDPNELPTIKQIDWTAFMLRTAVEEYARAYGEKLDEVESLNLFLVYLELANDAIRADSAYHGDLSRLSEEGYCLDLSPEIVVFFSGGLELLIKYDDYEKTIESRLSDFISGYPGDKKVEDYIGNLPRDLRGKAFVYSLLTNIRSKDKNSGEKFHVIFERGRVI